MNRHFSSRAKTFYYNLIAEVNQEFSFKYGGQWKNLQVSSWVANYSYLSEQSEKLEPKTFIIVRKSVEIRSRVR